jgi:hypothetical protein
VGNHDPIADSDSFQGPNFGILPQKTVVPNFNPPLIQKTIELGPTDRVFAQTNFTLGIPSDHKIPWFDKGVFANRHVCRTFDFDEETIDYGP